jgi:hypothetical protein
MSGVDHDPIRLGVLGGQRSKDSVEHEILGRECQTACSWSRWWLVPHYVLDEGCAGSAGVEPLT